MLYHDYQACHLCPRNCGVNRYHQPGFCGCTAEVTAARAGLHYYEEPFLSGTKGSGTVFFSGCSLGCVYCQNGQISRELYGLQISEERLTEIFLEQQARKAHNLNLVTGTHYIPSIITTLQEAKKQGLHIPVVWNSSGYEAPESLRMLDGLVDIFLPDLKTLNPDLGQRYLKAPDYPEWAKAAIQCMYEMVGDTLFEELAPEGMQGLVQEDSSKFSSDGSISHNAKHPELPYGKPHESVHVYEGEQALMKRGLVVRHLVIPGQVEDSKQVLRYLFETYGDNIWISLMSQYTPVGRFAGTNDEKASQQQDSFPELYRKVTDQEYEEVVDYAINLGIENCMIQEDDVAEESFIPVFDGTGIIVRST